jgi:nitric-oxide synthase
VSLDNPLIKDSTKLFLQVDIVDFNGSFLTRVRDLIGANPIILVATKVDLLPKGTSLEAVGDWLTQATLARKLNVISIHLTSAKAATGISGVASVIQRQRQGRDVYVMVSISHGRGGL